MNIFIEYLQYPFFVRALIVGGVISLILSWMSGYVVLRREVILSHSLSHIGFLGIAIAILFSWPILPMMFGACFIGAYLITLTQKKQLFHNDSLLEIFAQISLALAIVVISFFPGYRINIEQFLFGDILGISQGDVITSLILLVLTGGIIIFFHKTFLKISLSELLSHTLVKNKKFFNALLIMVLALMIALAIRIIGVLLVASFITIPANTAKLFAKSLKQTFIISVFLGFFSTILGLYISAIFDIPTGALIVLILMIFWLIGIFKEKIRDIA